MSGSLLIARKLSGPLLNHSTSVVDVQERSMIMPANGWAKDPRLREAGLYNLQNMLDGIRTIGWKMLIAAGYTADEVERLVEEAREWITDCNSHPYNRM